MFLKSKVMIATCRKQGTRQVKKPGVCIVTRCSDEFSGAGPLELLQGARYRVLSIRTRPGNRHCVARNVINWVKLKTPCQLRGRCSLSIPRRQQRDRSVLSLPISIPWVSDYLRRFIHRIGSSFLSPASRLLTAATTFSASLRRSTLEFLDDAAAWREPSSQCRYEEQHLLSIPGSTTDQRTVER